MKQFSGLWIDSKKAVLVTISSAGEKMQTLYSYLEKYFQHSRGNSSGGATGRRDLPAYDILERDKKAHLQKYYEDITSKIRNADSIYIFGPGRVKHELKSYIENNSFLTRDIKLEAADILTDIEILAKIRRKYSAYGRRSSIRRDTYKVGKKGKLKKKIS